MREKEKPLKISNPVSKRIIAQLINRNGSDKLYDLCSHIKVHQGSIRRRLESGDRSWAVAEDLFKIAKYFNVDIEWLLTGKSSKSVLNDEIKNWMQKAIKAEKNVKKLLKINKKLKAALLLVQDIEK